MPTTDAPLPVATYSTPQGAIDAFISPDARMVLLRSPNGEMFGQFNRHDRLRAKLAEWGLDSAPIDEALAKIDGRRSIAIEARAALDTALAATGVDCSTKVVGGQVRLYLSPEAAAELAGWLR